MSEDEPEGFKLQGPSIAIYSSLLLWDERLYQDWTCKRFDTKDASINRTILALKRLLGDMPPIGQEFIFKEIPELNDDLNNIFNVVKNLASQNAISDYDVTDAIQQTAHGWIYDNVYKVAFGASPLIKKKPHMGATT